MDDNEVKTDPHAQLMEKTLEMTEKALDRDEEKEPLICGVCFLRQCRCSDRSLAV